MKRKLQTVIATTFVASMFSLSAFAQDTDKGITQKNLSENGLPSLITFNEKSTYKGSDYKKVFRDQLGLKENQSFSKIKTESDKDGFAHEKFQLFHQGIKVEFATYSLHSKNGKLASMSGEFYKLDAVNTKAAISPEAAFNKAISHVGAKNYLWENPADALAMGYSKPVGELVLLPSMEEQGQKRTKDNVRLAYKFDIYATNPVGRGDLYIDANTGQALFYNATIKHLGEHSHGKSSVSTEKNLKSKNSNVTMVAANAATRYSGTQSIQTLLSGSSYILSDNTRGNGVQTFNMKKGTNYNTAVNFTDADNNWTAAEYANTNKDNGALDAHWGAEKTYDYWSTVHSRNSFDNAGATIKSYVHYSNAYDNAYWNGSVMTYGDGSGTYFDILTSIDVAAHEIGHAVCENTANLAYQKESGAMNEAFSDIWGACIEYYAAPTKSRWLIGEDIERRPGHLSLRSMDNPKSEGQPDTYGGTNWKVINCGTPTQSNDYCGVHTNSGVLNHWFYILSVGKSGTNDIGSTYNVTGITMDKAAKIAYRLESVYLSANSTYANARTSGIQSAIDLYGAGSPEVIATTNSFYAVGVGAAYSGSTDTTAPTAPTALAASGTTATTTNLSWTASTDNVAVTGYDIYQGATLKGSATTTTYSVTGLTASTAYTFSVKAKDAAGNVSAASNVVNVTTTAATPTYCTSQGNSASDELIGRVQFGTINNPSTGGTGYTDFTAISTNATLGTANTITITPTWTGSSYPEGYAVWIDYNADLDFADAGEQVWTNAASTTTPVSGTFTIPTTATLGVTRMRVSMKYNGVPTSCEAFSYGQVEDYTVTLVAGGVDTQAPTAPTAVAATGTTTTSTNLSWTTSTDNVGVTGYDVYQGATLKATVTTTTYSVTGLTAATAYTFSVKAKDAAGNISASSNVVNVTTLGSTVTYCTSQGNSVADEKIGKVQLGTINNTSTGGTGYTDFTSISTNLAVGTANTITVTPAWTSTVYSEGYSVWIDYNKDGDFADAGETVWTKATSTATTATGTFTIPATATLGTTRMRVSMKYNGIPTACEAFSYGQVEDYSVNISSTAFGIISEITASLNKTDEIIDFALYPNPVENELTILLSKNNGSTFRITNSLGQQVSSGKLSESAIDVSKLNTGIYIIEINNGQKTIAKKFIKK